ncbi:hypothetical protein RM780_26845 [Streptomyces sp. DSM 44917]|uniref:Uncharacterized protein n=1 Tax=Streptomyces boetiae TaxID=3075541 RepID=A0ABU2LH04_9ACTN|nr:hypothetical protein [Streptomyces sp. DSM 44917]MDT0310537.1 hypothetical protein [Streptomyces sp. DSM 44917]
MKSLSPHPTPPRRRLAAAAAGVVLALGVAAPAAVAQDEAGAAAHRVSRPAWDNVAPLSISPSSGGPNTSVTVKSTCQPSGPATSEAFQQSINLQPAGTNKWVGTGRIKSSGLVVGRTYSVTVRCSDGVTLSTSFTFTSSTPTGGAAAGFGGTGGAGGGKQATALAIGGGMAVAGAVGYVFLSRRRRATGNHL